MQLNESWIRRQRESRAWSQEHLAQVSGLGLLAFMVARVAVLLHLFEVGDDGKENLIGSPQLLFEDDANWEINIHGTPSGRSYRLVVAVPDVSSEG